MSFDISSPGDAFDSRDVIDRIEELEEIQVLDRTEGEQEELDALSEFEEQLNSHPDWAWGLTFIANDYFTDYAEELVKDLGYLSSDVPEWIAIDWEKTAEAILQDYSAYGVSGTTYWARD